MTAPRWHKVVADLLGNKTRTVLAILSITIGLFTIGFVSASGAIMMPEIDANYAAANPHSAIIYTESFEADVLQGVQALPGIGKVEGRVTQTVQLKTGTDQKLNLSLDGLPPVSQIGIDLLSPVDPPELPALADGEVWLENSSLRLFPAKVGDTIEVVSAGGKATRLKVAAIVRDVSMPAAMFGGPLSAFTTPATVEALGGPALQNKMLFTVSGNGHDQKHVREVIGAICKYLRGTGRVTCGSWMYNPGEHFSRQIFSGIMIVLNVLGGMAVLLSMFLVINTINALLGQHVRHIGIMKAVGGRTGQIVGMYLVLVVSYGLLAFLIAAPLSALAAYATSQMLAGMVNISLGGFRVVPLALLAQAGMALLIPLAAAAVPVFSGTRISVRRAIGNYGLASEKSGRGRLGRLLEKVSFLTRPMVLSLGNVFRRKGRLILTLSTLTLGGAIFISVFNLQDSIHKAVDDLTGYFSADVTVDFAEPYPISEVEQLALTVPEVTGAEAWGQSNVEMLSSDGSESEMVTLYAPPEASTLVKPVLESGRWLQPGDTNALVIGPSLLAKRPGLQVGDRLSLRLGEEETPWTIVGIYSMSGNVSPPLLYTTNESLDKYMPTPGLTYTLKVITVNNAIATQRRVAQALEKTLGGAGKKISMVQVNQDWLAQQRSSFAVVIYFLLVMAGLIALVGVLGLTGMMSMNVLERTREIGVLRAVGASNGAVLGMVILEGTAVGVVSWLLALAVSFPLTSALEFGVGVAMFQRAYPYVIGWQGAVLWLAGALLLSALASALPAGRAVKLTVRDVLAYE
jgi:putative ABC transport system permease protein